jgi:predicted CopG family antitoxin
MNSNNLDTIKVGDIAPTKFGIDLLAESVAEQVREGVADPINIAIRMNAMEQLVKAVKDKILSDVISELAKHPKSKAEVLGATVSVVDTVKYDYSHIAEWAELDRQIAELTEKRKEIETKEKEFYKGDLPVKSATTTFKVQLSK